MKRQAIACALPVLLLVTATASAQETQFAIGPSIGTTGIGVNLNLSLSEALGLRVGYNQFDYDTDFDDTDVSYDAEFDKDSVSLLLDWHPASGGFRVSAGAYSHADNAISVLATPDVGGTYTFNGSTYSADDVESISGSADFNKTTPYLGIGWGNLGNAQGFNLMLDLGVQFQDSPDVVLGVNGCSLPAAACARLENDLQVEVDELQEESEDFEFWPVVNLGVYYRF